MTTEKYQVGNAAHMNLLALQARAATCPARSEDRCNHTSEMPGVCGGQLSSIMCYPQNEETRPDTKIKPMNEGIVLLL